jgi:hypothetical protein
LYLEKAVTLNINTRYFLVLGIILVNSLRTPAQDSRLIGILPTANLNLQVRNDWSFNTKIETRYIENNPNLTDLSWVVAKNWGLNSRVAAGYLIRFEEGEISQRFIQQYAVVQRLRGFRLAHRWVADQTLSSLENPRIRFRYRIASELPLNGKTVDPGEFYLKINNEYLNAFQDRGYDLEIRCLPTIGFEVVETIKIESGLDYRVNSFLQRKPEQSFWLTFAVFLDL